MVRLLPMALSLAAAAVPAQAGSSAIHPVQDRLELRSYEPYAGLRFDWDVPRYVPPQRGLAPARPQVIMPSRKSPVIHQGTPEPYTAHWYAYCSGRYLSFEPGTGLYTTYSGQRRTCR